MKKLLYFFSLMILTVSCKEIPLREDLNVRLKSIDNTPYTGNPSNSIIEIQEGQTKIFKLEFAGNSPLREYKIGTDYDKDQSSYLIAKPEIGATSGVFEFSMNVDELVDGVVVNNSSSKLFKVDLIDEQGTVGHFSVTIKKQM